VATGVLCEVVSSPNAFWDKFIDDFAAAYEKFFPGTLKGFMS
jgi:hypothetical protein